MKEEWRLLARVLRQSMLEWLSGRLPRRAAGLAFYTAFSLAPLLLLLSIATGELYRDSEAEVLAQITRLLPGSSADAVQVLLEGLRQRQGSGMAAIVGFIGLSFGATGVFVALQDALNDGWAGSADENPGLLRFVTRRLMSIAMVMAVGFLLLVSLVMNSLLSVLVSRYGTGLAGGPAVWHAINRLMALGMATGVFTLLFRLVPIAPVGWRPAAVGGLVSALLFGFGEVVLAWYLGDAARLSVYGVFGSLIVLLLWVYYSAQILLFGATVARNYAEESRSPDGFGLPVQRRRAGDRPWHHRRSASVESYTTFDLPADAAAAPHLRRRPPAP